MNYYKFLTDWCEEHYKQFLYKLDLDYLKKHIFNIVEEFEQLSDIKIVSLKDNDENIYYFKDNNKKKIINYYLDFIKNYICELNHSLDEWYEEYNVRDSQIFYKLNCWEFDGTQKTFIVRKKHGELGEKIKCCKVCIFNYYKKKALKKLLIKKIINNNKTINNNVKEKILKFLERNEIFEFKKRNLLVYYNFEYNGIQYEKRIKSIKN